MKIMTQEEKAQAYDKAIEVIRKCETDKYGCVIGIKPSDIFRELQESEDERIRKALLNEFIHLQSKGCKFAGLEGEKIVAWLEEKKGEQKVEVKYVYTKFRIGDVIVEIKSNGYCQPVTVKYIGEGAYSCESDDGKRYLSFPIINQDEYKLVEQKTARSEDEFAHIVGYLVQDIVANEHTPEEEKQPTKFFVEKYYNKLRPQDTWKPSDVQMRILSIYADQNNTHGAVLTSLYQDLKKLKR